MRRLLTLSVVILLFALDAYAQPGMQGMRMSSFGGTVAGLENPALLANVRNRWEVNLSNMNYTLENSDIKLNWRDFTSGQNINFNASSLGNIQDFSLKNIVEFQGPSVMFNLKNKLAIGFSTRVRSFTQLNSMDLSLVQPLFENRPFDLATDGKIVEPYLNVNLQTFADFGISGAYKVLRLKKHNLFVGATARIYRGLFAFDFTGQDIDIDLDQAVNDSVLNINADLALKASVPADADFLNNGDGLSGFLNPGVVLNSLVQQAAGSGFGFDIGAVYEGKLLKRKLRAGVSITDIGSVRYNKGIQYGASFVANNVSIHKDSLDNFPSGYDSIKAYAASYGVVIDTSIGETSFSQSLPTRINLFADLQIVKGFYVSVMTALDATSSGQLRSNYSNYLSVIPRFQSKRVEAWVPITYNAFSSQAQVGVGARISAFYFGTNNITDIIQGEVKGFNFYLGARVSSLRSKKKNDKNKGDK